MDMKDKERMIGLIKFISYEKRSRIMEKLISEGAESFKGLSRQLSMRPTVLAYHLKLLVDEGLIGKEFVNEEGRRDYTRYGPTPSGLEVWSAADILGIGREAVSEKGPHPTGVPSKIEVLPMEIGPRLLTLREAD